MADLDDGRDKDEGFPGVNVCTVYGRSGSVHTPSVTDRPVPPARSGGSNGRAAYYWAWFTTARSSSTPVRSATHVSRRVQRSIRSVGWGQEARTRGASGNRARTNVS